MVGYHHVVWPLESSELKKRQSLEAVADRVRTSSKIRLVSIYNSEGIMVLRGTIEHLVAAQQQIK